MSYKYRTMCILYSEHVICWDVLLRRVLVPVLSIPHFVLVRLIMLQSLGTYSLRRTD